MRPKGRQTDPQMPRNSQAALPITTRPKAATVTPTLKAPTNTLPKTFQESPWLLTSSEPFLCENVFFSVCFLYSLSSPFPRPGSPAEDDPDNFEVVLSGEWSQGSRPGSRSEDGSFGPKLLAQRFGKPGMALLPARQCHTYWNPRALQQAQWQPQMAACPKSSSLPWQSSQGPHKEHRQEETQ